MFYGYNRYGWNPNNNQPFWQSPLDFHNTGGPFGVWPFQIENEPFPLKSNYFPNPYLNPFFKHNLMQPPMYSLFSYFQDKNGNFDFNKMVSTFGQITSTVKQVSPLFKSFGSLLGKIQ